MTDMFDKNQITTAVPQIQHDVVALGPKTRSDTPERQNCWDCQPQLFEGGEARNNNRLLAQVFRAGLNFSRQNLPDLIPKVATENTTNRTVNFAGLMENAFSPSAKQASRLLGGGAPWRWLGAW